MFYPRLCHGSTPAQQGADVIAGLQFGGDHYRTDEALLANGHVRLNASTTFGKASHGGCGWVDGDITMASYGFIVYY